MIMHRMTILDFLGLNTLINAGSKSEDWKIDKSFLD